MKIKILTFICLCCIYSCSDYLYVVPDDIPTMDHAFSNRTTTEKFLFTCYSYLPDPANPFAVPGLMSSRECWMLPSEGSSWYWVYNNADGANLNAWHIARGLQNTNRPQLNFWDGDYGGNNLFIALRDCNIFLENVDKASGIEPAEKKRWIAEVNFLKAYYHFFLLRMYGPIPIIDDNIPVYASPDEVRVFREPVDDVVEYIVTLLDTIAGDLPPYIINETEELGRVTKPVALALKAKTLALAASPIFNGNPYYSGFTDSRGIALFPQGEPNVGKWERAAEAIREAIECAVTEGRRDLYIFNESLLVTPVIQTELSIRGAVTERWNREIIWGTVKDDSWMQRLSTVRHVSNTNLTYSCALAPTLDVAELFYTDNGLPINEDYEYASLYQNRYKTQVATSADSSYIRKGFETAGLHFKREPRFYASLTFDGCWFFGNSDINSPIEMKAGTTGGRNASERYSITGYFPKKMVNRKSVFSSSGFTNYIYSFPFIRLADLYLLYAEALNEIKNTPDDEVFQWIDSIRIRAGLKGVRDTWEASCSMHPEYITNKDRMREIIHRERLIELVFENEPYWDILRWKEAETRWNRPIRGWNIYGSTTGDFYDVRAVGSSSFGLKDYLAPIKQSSIDINPNLRQNPGW